MCTHGDMFSLAVLIGRGLDHIPLVIPSYSPSSATLFSFQGAPLTMIIHKLPFNNSVTERSATLFVILVYLIILTVICVELPLDHFQREVNGGGDGKLSDALSVGIALGKQELLGFQPHFGADPDVDQSDGLILRTA